MSRILKLAASWARQTDWPGPDRGIRTNHFAMLFVAAVVVCFLSCLLSTGQYPLARGHDGRYPEQALTWQQLDHWYPITEGPNAAEVYQQAFAANRKSADDGMFDNLTIHDIQQWPDPLPRDLAEVLLDYVNRHAEPIAMCERAADIRQCRFGAVESEPNNVYLTEHHQGMRTMAKLLYLAALSESDRGQTTQACRRVAQIARIADALHEEPMLVSAYLSYRLRSNACDLAERLMRSASLSDRDLALLKDALSLQSAGVPPWYLDLNTHNCNTEVIHRIARNCQSQLRRTRVHLIIELARREQGRFPNALADLSPA